MFMVCAVFLIIGVLIGLMLGPSTERIESAFNDGFMQGLEVGQENAHRGRTHSKWKKEK